MFVDTHNRCSVSVVIAIVILMTYNLKRFRDRCRFLFRLCNNAPFFLFYSASIIFPIRTLILCIYPCGNTKICFERFSSNSETTNTTPNNPRFIPTSAIYAPHGSGIIIIAFSILHSRVPDFPGDQFGLPRKRRQRKFRTSYCAFVRRNVICV